MKIKKDNILRALQERVPLTYETVKEIYDITQSYDEILKLNDFAIKYNVDIVQLAQFLFRRFGK